MASANPKCYMVGQSHGWFRELQSKEGICTVGASPCCVIYFKAHNYSFLAHCDNADNERSGWKEEVDVSFSEKFHNLCTAMGIRDKTTIGETLTFVGSEGPEGQYLMRKAIACALGIDQLMKYDAENQGENKVQKAVEEAKARGEYKVLSDSLQTLKSQKLKDLNEEKMKALEAKDKNIKSPGATYCAGKNNILVLGDGTVKVINTQTYIKDEKMEKINLDDGLKAAGIWRF